MGGMFDYKRYPIVIVDDEPSIVSTFTMNFDEEFHVLGATTGARAIELVAEHPVAVLVADQRMPDMHGVDVIERCLAARPDIVPIVLTGFTDWHALVRAVNLGRIFRYITKPWEPKELDEALRGAIEHVHLTRENARLSQENARLVDDLRVANDILAGENSYFRAHEATAFEGILGSSKAIEMAKKRAAQAGAHERATVLITGPSGSGKELLARAIHESSPRRDRMFVAVNCGALTESLLMSELFGHRKGAFTGAIAQKGIFEIADGGTLFLDEIGEASDGVQVALLRVLAERKIRPLGMEKDIPIDVRVIAATNRNLKEQIEEKRFRNDLYFRLAVGTIHIPPLNERREDIPLLIEHFVRLHSATFRRPVPAVAPDAIELLLAHDYEGNVRELSNLIERTLMFSADDRALTADDFFELDGDPAAVVDAPQAYRDLLRAWERDLFSRVLARHDGNMTQAAKELRLSYRWFLKVLKRCGLRER